MNNRGSYTALIALACLVLIMSTTFLISAQTSSLKAFSIAREGGDLKRVYHKAKLVLDKAAAYAMAEQVLDNYYKNHVCQQAADYTAKVNLYMTSALQSIKAESGFDCKHEIVGKVVDAVPFTVKLGCSRDFSHGVKEVSHVETRGSFELEKEVIASGACNVDVNDLDSGRIQVSLSS